MRIPDSYNKIAAHPSTVGTDKVGDASVANSKDAKAPAKEAAKVSISDKARELSARTETSFDEAKVTRLRENIESGDFKVDAAKIAQRLVGEGDG